MFIPQFIIPICLVVLGNNSFDEFEIPDRNQYYFRGKENGQRHTLTMNSDSTFHITVPNKSGSCWTWGEYGGKIAIQSDTIRFHFIYVPTEDLTDTKPIETFISDSKQNLTRISPKQFMFENYQLKKWRGNYNDFELE